VVIANPPYGLSWKGYQKDINNDKTERFKFLPSVSDGQLEIVGKVPEKRLN